MSILPNYKVRDHCRLCNSPDLAQGIELQPTPPANAFLAVEMLEKEEYRYPLRLCVCMSCHHAQLIDIVDPEVLFGDYRYMSGISPVFVKHLSILATELIGSSSKSAPFVVEIGSNDGTLIDFFKKCGASVLGVEPSERLANYAIENGRPTINTFFGSKCATSIVEKFGLADIVCANNVLAHIDDLQDVFSGVKLLLDDDGIFVFEVAYLVDLVERGLFDTIYHEHLSYHSVTPMQRFVETFGLRLFAAKRINTQGGSIRFYIEHETGTRPIDGSVEELVSLETQLGLDGLQPYDELAGRISSAGSALRERIDHYRNNNKRIAGFGAPAKLTTLLHEFRISGDSIAFVAEDNEFKVGLFTPGLHVPIHGPESLYEQDIDIVVVFAWNFAASIIERHRTLTDRGVVFVIPLPNLIEVNRDNVDTYLQAHSAGPVR